MVNQFVGVCICTLRMLIKSVFFYCVILKLKQTKELMTVVPYIFGYICYYIMICKETDITWEIIHNGFPKMPFKYLLCEMPCVLCKKLVLLLLFVLFVFFFCLACTQG